MVMTRLAPNLWDAILFSRIFEVNGALIQKVQFSRGPKKVGTGVASGLGGSDLLEQMRNSASGLHLLALLIIMALLITMVMMLLIIMATIIIVFFEIITILLPLSPLPPSFISNVEDMLLTSSFPDRSSHLTVKTTIN